MKNFSTNPNLISQIQKEYKENIPLNTINPKNNTSNRNQTFYELDKFYNKQIGQYNGEETNEKNYFNNKRNTERCSKIVKKKLYQNKLYNTQYTDKKAKVKININEKILSFDHLKNKLLSKKQKDKNHKDIMTYSLDSKKSINNEYYIDREYKEDKEHKKELENYYIKGLKEKTYQILTNIVPNSVENKNNKSKKKHNKFSENKYINNCHKKNAKIEYERLFTYYNYDNNFQFDKFNSLNNNFQNEKLQKLRPYNSNTIKNIKCSIKLNNYNYQKNYKLEGFEKENINNNYINNYKNNNKYLDSNLINKETEKNKLYSSNNIKTFGMYEIQNECFSENELGNNIRKVNSPTEYVSSYSTGTKDNNKIQYYNQYNNNNCLPEQKVINNGKDNIKENKLTYQLENSNECICFHSLNDFHCIPHLHECLVIDNIENFGIISKNHNIEKFSLQIIPDNCRRTINYPKINNKSFTIFPIKKLYNNSSVQNNLDEEINKENLKNKRLQIKIAKEKSVYIKGKNKSKNEYKNKGTNTNEIIEYTISYNDEFYFINDNQYKNRRRDLLTQIILKTNLKEKSLLKNSFIDWYNKAMKLVDLDINMKRKKLKIKRNGTFEIIQKISKSNKCCGNEFIPNKIVSNLKIEIKNNIKKKDKGILIDIPYGFKNENLKKRKINDIICESNKAYFNQLRIKEILIKYILSKATSESILKKYFSIWYRKSKYILLLENAKIISEFCKLKLNYILIVKKWQKLYKNYVLKVRKTNAFKIIKKLKIRKSKLYKLIKLIKITRLMQIFNKKKFLRYLILCWYINTNRTLTKKNQMKILYENMLTTYISIADDIFGNNKKNNPSIQYSMVEAVDSNRYHTTYLDKFYSENIQYTKSQNEKETKFGFYKKYINNYISPEKYSKNKNEEHKINYDKRRTSYKSERLKNNNLKFFKK